MCVTGCARTRDGEFWTLMPTLSRRQARSFARDCVTDCRISGSIFRLTSSAISAVEKAGEETSIERVVKESELLVSCGIRPIASSKLGLEK